MPEETPDPRRLADLFCTPPAGTPAASELRALGEARRFSVPDGGRELDCWEWGTGPTVLLCHGWGSRAAHFVLMARVLARSGLCAVAFDAPAHSSRSIAAPESRSSMFAFSRAIAAVAHARGGVHGLVGHSLGAMAALFALAAYPPLADGAFPCGRLALLSAPAHLCHVVSNFCRGLSLDGAARRALEQGLESAFDMDIGRYDCAEALRRTGKRALIVQDRDDAEFAPEETLAAALDEAPARTVFTAGLGHDRILANRGVFGEIIGFMKE